MNERRPRGRLWSLALLLAMVPPCYLASFGPLLWLDRHDSFPAAAVPAATIYMTPLFHAYKRGPAAVRWVIDRYSEAWTGHASDWDTVDSMSE